jgi:hypothetical protein
MRKLKLDLDDLTVTSFDVRADEGTDRGTVEARGVPTRNTNCATCASVCDTCATNCLPYC